MDLLIDTLLRSASADRSDVLLRHAAPRGLDHAALLAAISDRGAELAIADTPRGERTSRLAIELADQLALASVAARARVTLGHVLNYATRFDDALSALDEAARMGIACGDQFAVARASLVSMHALARLGRMDDAVAAGGRAITGFDAIGESVWRAKADVNLGVLKRMRDDAAGALAHFEAARAVFASSPPILAQIESNRAEALLDLARFPEAERAFESALAAFQAAGATHAAGIAEGNLADLLSRQGRYESALAHFEGARRALEAVGAPADLARLQSEEGEALASIGMDEEAVETYRRSISALDAAGMVAESARARVGQARPLERLSRHSEADAALQRAIENFAGIPNPTACARAGVQRASLLLRSGRPTEALAAIDPIIPELRDRPADLAGALLVRASINLALAQAGQADADASQALTLALRLGMTPLVCDAHHLRGLALASMDRLDEAVGALSKAIDAAERLRGSLQADRFRAAAMTARHMIYEDAIALLLRRAQGGRLAGRAGADPDLTAAFEVADRARARALLDLVHGGVELADQLATGATEADAALLRELSQCRAAMNALYDRLFSPDSTAGSPPPQSRRAEIATTLEAHERRVVEIERRMAATRRFQGFSPAPVGEDELRAVLADDEALIEFVGVHGTLHAIVVRRDRPVAFTQLAPCEEVAELGERLSMTIDRAVVGAVRRATGTVTPPANPDSACARVLSRLHAAIFAPIEPQLVGIRRLLISPHDTLHAMPLQALARDGASLIEQFEVVIVPSAALVWHARTNPPAVPAGLPLVVGVPDDVAPEMGEEAAAVAKSLGQARLLVGTAATFAEFSKHSATAPLIHLACHGVFPSRNPMQARLRFSDAWVTVREILGLSLPGSVVVLSGCETGRSGVARGDEAYGLGRALIAAGASAVVMSLWPVHDRTTRELMESVYQGLGRGYLSGGKAGAVGEAGAGGGGETDVARLLAVAQRGLIARGVHPALWAPFVVMGEPM